MIELVMALTKDDLKQIGKLLGKQRKEINHDIGDVIDRGFNSLDERINGLEERMDGFEETMERRFDAVDERLDRHYEILMNHNGRVKKLEKIHPGGRHSPSPGVN